MGLENLLHTCDPTRKASLEALHFAIDELKVKLVP